MSIFFLLNNIHFTLELLGALAFMAVAWLAFDAFRIRRDFTTISRGIGFAFLSLWQVIHAFNLGEEFYGYGGYTLYIIGLLFIIINLLEEAPVEKPTFKAILILPAFSLALFYLNIAAAVGMLLIFILSLVQYLKENKKALIPFWAGFLFLFLGAVFSIFSGPELLDARWIAGHFFEFAGFFSVGWWVWSYLQARIQESMVLIFVTMALLISAAVTLVFSTILITRVEDTTETNLLTNVKVMEFAVTRLKEEALAKVRFLASKKEIQDAFAKNNFPALESLLTKFLEDEKLGFLMAVDKEGYVLIRAHALTQKDDNAAGEYAAGEALEGRTAVTIEPSAGEKFSIRAAAPVTLSDKKKRVITGGALIAGFPLDNAFADMIKKITGLEMSIFEKDTLTATTVLNPDGRTRNTGIKITDTNIIEQVSKKGEPLTVRTVVTARPFLASYLPIKDLNGQFAGMLSAAKPEKEIVALVDATNRLTFVTVALLMLILSAPIYFITKRLSSAL